MKIVALMRELVAKGMAWEDAAMFAEKFEEGIEEAIERVRPVRSNNAERQARFRARKATSVTNNATNNAPHNVTAPKDVSPTPPSESTPFPPLKGGTSPTKSIEAQPEKPKQTSVKPLSLWVAEMWELTPHTARQRTSRPQVENALKAAVRRGHDPAAVRDGLGAYYASPDATKDGAAFAKGAHRVIQTDLWQSFEPESPPDPSDGDPWPRRLLQWRKATYWNSEWGPKPGKPGYQGPPVQDLAA